MKKLGLGVAGFFAFTLVAALVGVILEGRRPDPAEVGLDRLRSEVERDLSGVLSKARVIAAERGPDAAVKSLQVYASVSSASELLHLRDSLAALVPIAPAASEPSEVCWHEKGGVEPSAFGSSEQLLELKALDTAACALTTIAWTLPAIRRTSLLMWDHSTETLHRIHRDRSGQVTWEAWERVSRGAVAQDLPEDGFDLPGYRNGRGRSPLTPRIAAELRERGGYDFVFTR